ncbi:MAG: hypothetical protein RLZZ241_1150 [Bacteroidota bacterium]
MSTVATLAWDGTILGTGMAGAVITPGFGPGDLTLGMAGAGVTGATTTLGLTPLGWVMVIITPITEIITPTLITFGAIPILAIAIRPMPLAVVEGDILILQKTQEEIATHKPATKQFIA